MSIEAEAPSAGRLIRTVAVTTLVAVPGFLVIYALFADTVFINAVPRAEELGFAPSMTPMRAVAERQTEKHTCGLHCLNSLYRAHRLDPGRHALRFRLGVDRVAVPAVHSTQGTLQPDMTRVLAQDGFLVRGLDLDDTPGSADNLKKHLSQSWFALALIRKISNGHLHWVLLQDESMPNSIEVVDSLADPPYSEKAESFVREKAVSVYLVKPNQGDIRAEIKSAHRLGVSSMKQTPGRIKDLESKH